MKYEDYEFLKMARNGRILSITLNRPEALNAVNAGVHRELSQIFTDVDRDEETDVAILQGAGGSFCAGGDLKWMKGLSDDPMKWVNLIRDDRRIQNSFLDLEKPIIAKVEGPAIGLGATLALFCDFVYATPKSRFADPHVSVGLVAGDGGAVIWPQLIGYARARRYLLTGDHIMGEEAAAIGLITECVAPEELDATVNAMAERMASAALMSVRFTKASINAELKNVANAVIDRAAAYELISGTLQDHQIALDAFAAKRKPEFTGR